MNVLAPGVAGFVSLGAGLLLLAGLSAGGCGDSFESSDAGPIDAGEVECGDACDDLLDIGHIIEHVEDIGG